MHFLQLKVPHIYAELHPSINVKFNHAILYFKGFENVCVFMGAFKMYPILLVLALKPELNLSVDCIFFPHFILMLLPKNSKLWENNSEILSNWLALTAI